MFITRVERNFEAAHTNGPPDGKCATMHGHSWQVKLEVGMLDKNLDEWGWTIDFTGIKRLIDAYDHKTLNGMEGLEKPSAEYVAMKLWNDTVDLAAGRAEYVQVTISEGAGNTLVYTGPDDIIDPSMLVGWSASYEAGLSTTDDTPEPVGEKLEGCGPDCRCVGGK